MREFDTTVSVQKFALIRRRKIARSRLATGPGAAWHWVYDATDKHGDTIVYGADRLRIAERMARAAGYADLVREWEVR